MAVYPAAVKRLIPPGKTDPRITPRVAILHVDAGGASGEDLARYFNGPSGGIESHFHIEYDGTVYQYRDTAYQADANWHANDFAISIETQGKAAGQWTPAQLASIKALLLWCHATHGIPLVQCPRWDGSGVGYHILFMQEWAGGPRACPGPDRIKQFQNVLVPWMKGGAVPTPVKEWDEMATKEEIQAVVRAEVSAAVDKIANRVWTKDDTIAAPWSADPNNKAWTAASTLQYLYLMAMDAQKGAKTQLTPEQISGAVKAAMPADANVDVDELARKIVLELGKES